MSTTAVFLSSKISVPVINAPKINGIPEIFWLCPSGARNAFSLAGFELLIGSPGAVHKVRHAIFGQF